MKLDLEFLDGKYLDNKVILINDIPLPTPNLSNSTNSWNLCPFFLIITSNCSFYRVWNGSITVNLEEYDSMSKQQEVSTTIHYTLNITNAEEKDYSNFRLLLKVSSDSMNIDITALVTWDTFVLAIRKHHYSL